MTIWVKNGKGYDCKVEGAEFETTEEEWQKIQKEYPEFAIPYYKSLLMETDYIAIKYAEGIISEDDYNPIKEKRQEWRKMINALQTK